MATAYEHTHSAERPKRVQVTDTLYKGGLASASYAILE